MENSVKNSPPKWRKWFKYTYLTVVHILAGVACFFILTALAVKFKWTNDSGNVDVNNRYYESMANQYGNEAKKDSATLARDEYLMFQKLGVLARFTLKMPKSLLTLISSKKTSTRRFECWMLWKLC